MPDWNLGYRSLAMQGQAEDMEVLTLFLPQHFCQEELVDFGGACDLELNRQGACSYHPHPKGWRRHMPELVCQTGRQVQWLPSRLPILRTMTRHSNQFNGSLNAIKMLYAPQELPRHGYGTRDPFWGSSGCSMAPRPILIQPQQHRLPRHDRAKPAPRVRRSYACPHSGREQAVVTGSRRAASRRKQRRPHRLSLDAVASAPLPVQVGLAGPALPPVTQLAVGGPWPQGAGWCARGPRDPSSSCFARP